MKNESKMLRILILTFAATGCLLITGAWQTVSAQKGDRDPFRDPVKAKVTSSTTDSSGKPAKPAPPPVVPLSAPPIQDRIAYFKMMRARAAEQGLPLPKLTSVLTLDEMSVTGIFRTPKGYAAMVQANPVKLSYTVYPGDKFFDGQLVAIEENRAMFRKVTKWSNGKFVTSQESMALRKYSQQEELQGTAPANSGAAEKTQSAAATPPVDPNAPKTAGTAVKVTAPAVIVSPLDEMNRQPEEKAKTNEKSAGKNKKGSTKTVSTKKVQKVAKNQE